VHSLFGKINYGGLKHNSLYLGLELPSDGWQSLIKCILTTRCHKVRVNFGLLTTVYIFQSRLAVPSSKTSLSPCSSSSSQILMPRMNGVVLPTDSEPSKLTARNTVASVKPSTAAKRTGLGPDLETHTIHSVKIRPSPPCFSTAKTANKVQVIIQPGKPGKPNEGKAQYSWPS